MRGRVFGFVVLAYAVAVAYAGDQHPAAARQQALKLDGNGTPDHIVANLRKDAENQKRIKDAKRGSDDTSAQSMSPHLSHHADRGEEAAGRGRSHHRSSTQTQKSIHGVLKLPPDEATPFFDTYVLKYAFPTIALICSCLACVLFRTMRMYQKERWKGTSYFHGARRSAESLLPGLK